ncbi:MAG: hypothetical protein ACRDSN_03435 [Pseudonocardiaceae bacterium]
MSAAIRSVRTAAAAAEALAQHLAVPEPPHGALLCARPGVSR